MLPIEACRAIDPKIEDQIEFVEEQGFDRIKSLASAKAWRRRKRPRAQIIMAAYRKEGFKAAANPATRAVTSVTMPLKTRSLRQTLDRKWRDEVSCSLRRK